MTQNTSFIDPSSLSLPSPAHSSHSSPAPSTSEHHDDSHEAGPSRKRARTDATSEERKEARAHRNRIAAQNSRDRRKAQYAYLERRVAELEEENRQLKAGMGIASNSDRQRAEEREKEKARERENEELRERIKTLEKGWDAVVKALAAQGLPTGIPPTPKSESSSPTSPISRDSIPTQPTSSSSSDSPSPRIIPQQHQAATFPVIVPIPPAFPISPAASHSSLDFDFNLPTSGPSIFSSVSNDFKSENIESQSTRHLAAGGLSLSSSLDSTTIQPTLTFPSLMEQEPQAIDDATMEDLFREILAPSPTLPSSSLPHDTSMPVFQVSSASETASPTSTSPMMGESTGEGEGVGMGLGLQQMTGVNWASEMEMQRILDMLPNTINGDDYDHHTQNASDLDLEFDLGGLGWETGNNGAGSEMVGAF